MKTLTEAVKACGGVWPSKSTSDIQVLYDEFAQTRLVRLRSNGALFTPEEFEVRATELSGKPGWGEAPEWAQWLGQSSHGGNWEWYESKPKLNDGHWSHSPYRGVLACYGTVLGDWRNTLERRPEVDVDAVVSGFDDLGLPTEGTECEYRIGGGDTPWYSCKVLYVLRGNDDPDADGWRAVVWCPHLEKDQLAFLPRFEFRPLKSDRERWVEAADKLVSSVDAGPYLMLETVYDALISGELPTPEAR